MKAKMRRYLALDRKVLTVAIEGEVEDWAAYIGAVPGNSHQHESEEVARHGTKLPFDVAKALFPDFHRRFRWRA